MSGATSLLASSNLSGIEMDWGVHMHTRPHKMNFNQTVASNSKFSSDWFVHLNRKKHRADPQFWKDGGTVLVSKHEDLGRTPAVLWVQDSAGEAETRGSTISVQYSRVCEHDT